MNTEIVADSTALARALASVGRDERLRNLIFDELRREERMAADPLAFRRQVRWPLVLAMLGEVKMHCVVLQSGLVFEVCPDSRIERALFLSPVAHPDHVWGPQTTRLLNGLAAETSHAIVGGAYIGDQALPMAQVMAAGTSPGQVHAFEPAGHAFRHLTVNVGLNGLSNVLAHRNSLWDRSGKKLRVSGDLALAFSQPLGEGPAESDEIVESVAIDDYVRLQGLSGVGLIRLAIEGGEEKALRGAVGLLSRPGLEAPHVIFELHRLYTDWSNGLEETPAVSLLQSHGYTVFAVRDFGNNYPMAGQPVEIIPVDRVYLDGPPHGFNLLATKDSDLIRRHRLQLVEHVSPKLILDKDPALHHPIGGLPEIRADE